MTTHEAAGSAEARLAAQPMLRLDTRTVVGALLFAVAFSANMQITERLDQVWTGGLAVPLGYTFAQLWWPAAVVVFGLTGALIVSNFNPIIAVLSATHPLAWSFFFLNMSEMIPLAYMLRWHIKNRGELTLVPFLVYVAIGAGIANVVQAIGLYEIVIGLPFSRYIVFTLWQWLMAIFIGGPMGFYFYKAVVRSGVFR